MLSSHWIDANALQRLITEDKMMLPLLRLHLCLGDISVMRLHSVFTIDSRFKRQLMVPDIVRQKTVLIGLWGNSEVATSKQLNVFIFRDTGFKDMYLIKTNFHDLNFYICISISESICNSVYSCTDTARSDNPNALPSRLSIWWNLYLNSTEEPKLCLSEPEF